jgi:urease accessory protein
MKNRLPYLLFPALFLCPALAQAHTGHGATSGFWPGLHHPLSGLDHITAMLAVGLWAAQLGGRALWAVPLSFVSVMALGGSLGVSGVPIPYAEQGIVMSVLILGVMIAAAVRLPLGMSCALVGLFALCHGYAHGAELPLSSSGLAYGLGFMLSTALLHLGGIALGIGFQKVAQARLVRMTGAGIAACGVYLLVA